VNGSGKHLNWSLGDNTGCNYLEPSASPLKNISFLLTLGAVLLGIDRFGGLLRATVADAGNDHRLGANEAPPAIMSVYLGEYLTKIVDEIEGMGKPTESQMASINMGVRNLPKIAKDYSDRNRTSPVAFTGNKFEFRACGSSQNPAEGFTTLNMLATYGYQVIEKRLAASGSGDVKQRAIMLLKDIFRETKRVRFEGNNYSEDWHREAKKRKLPNARNTPAALDAYLEKEVIDLMEKNRILTERELRAKVEIKLETYTKTKEIEYKTAVNIGRTLVLPALAKQMTQTGGAAAALKASGVLSSALIDDVKALETLYVDIRNAVTHLEKTVQQGEAVKDHHERAKFLAESGEAALIALRRLVDQAEEITANEFWPMAKYQELLTVL
jgi:glutamine synthetase